MVVVAYLRGLRSVQGQAARFREELSKWGYGGPAGFDPDASKNSLFRSFQAYVGSATFIIVSPAGELVWFMQDPRGEDTTFARMLLSRWMG